MLEVDPAAAATLRNIYWRAGAWTRGTDRVMPTGAELDHAVAAGYLFEAVTMDHDELVDAVRELGARLDRSAAADAFLASLSSRALVLRPGLSALTVAQQLPAHELRPAGTRPSGRRYDGGAVGTCEVCGLPPGRREIDRNLLNFERLQWGGVRHLQLDAIWFTLERFATEGGASPRPADRALADRVWDTLASLPPATTLTKSQAALRFLPSNEAERLVLLEHLSVIGILADDEHPGFLHRATDAIDRVLPDQRHVDRGYPGAWWTAAAGVDRAAVQAVFGGD